MKNPVVPFFSQRLNEANFKLEGFADLASAEKWTDRICGLACVKMVVAHFTGRAVPLAQLLEKGLRLRAYKQGVGWIHKGLVQLAGEYGVAGKAEPIGGNLSVLSEYLADNELVVASVGDGLDGTRRGGHLVTITEHRESGFVLHHPSSCRDQEWPDYLLSHQRLSACLSERGNIIRFFDARKSLSNWSKLCR